MKKFVFVFGLLCFFYMFSLFSIAYANPTEQEIEMYKGSIFYAMFNEDFYTSEITMSKAVKKFKDDPMFPNLYLEGDDILATPKYYNMNRVLFFNNGYLRLVSLYLEFTEAEKRDEVYEGILKELKETILKFSVQSSDDVYCKKGYADISYNGRDFRLKKADSKDGTVFWIKFTLFVRFKLK